MLYFLKRLCVVFYGIFFVFFAIPLFAQTHTSIPMENQIYIILEQAQARGLCSVLSGVRPYTQNVVVNAINEILGSEPRGSASSAGRRGLSRTEREILEQYLLKFSKPSVGLDLLRGGYYGETAISKDDDSPLSINAGVSGDIQGSAAFFSGGDNYWGTEIWAQAYLNGDLGNFVSYGFDFAGGLIKAPRNFLGLYNTYYEGFENVPGSEYQNEMIRVYTQPLTYFPYSYKKRWDGSIYFLGNLSSFEPWPDSLAGGYGIDTEITGSFLDDKLIMRAGRISHDWGSGPVGSSLAFNQMARPFAALEAEFNPVPWFSIASLAGVLEYNNRDGIKNSSQTFQNAFSITMIQFRYKDYVFFDFIDAVIWPKRFEIGYMIPIINNYFYQNNVGDFDNIAMAFNLRLQYPGFGFIWGSFFIDEMNFTSNIRTLDRQMFAWQAGINLPVPVWSFSSVKLSYTKVNPYNYTHNRNFNPWYGDLRMETAYINNGASLGHYLPPNSDEILARLTTMPSSSTVASIQYQLIRRGADFGSSAVDGSNLLSELDPGDRDDKSVLKRFFLRDGAYQWQHIVRLGIDWNLSTAPISFYGEAGAVISYFTNIEAEANVTGQAHSYSVINTQEYPRTTGFIMKFGVRIFPR